MLLLHQNKTVGRLTIFSGLIAFASLALGAVAVNYHFEVFNDPSLILSLPGTNAQAGKWSMICDMLGYYMLLLPVIFYLHAWLKNKTPWRNLITFCGLAYVLIGSIGASILAVIWPTAMHAYSATTPVGQQIIKANFEVVNTMVYNGMWNLLELLFASAWWFLSGVVLFKNGYKGIAIAALSTSLFSVLDSFSGMINNDALHQAALNGYLYLSIVWTIWIGVTIYRRPLGDMQTLIKGQKIINGRVTKLTEIH